MRKTMLSNLGAIRITVLIGGLLGASISFATTHADFFCNEAPAQTPGYYGIGTKDCGPTKPEVSNNGVCLETVFCAHVGQLQIAAQAVLHKDFASLTLEEKKTFVKNKQVEMLPTILTCKGEIKTGLGPMPVAVCPAPEDCKGDLLYKMQPAVIDLKKAFEMNDRFQKGASLIFQSQPNAGAAP